MRGHKIPYYNALDDFENAAILNRGQMAREINKTVFNLDIEGEDEEETDPGRGGIVLNPAVSWVEHDLKVTCKTWYDKPLDPGEYPNGFEKETMRNPVTGINTVVFYKKSLLDEEGKIKGQTKEHYLQNALLAGECALHGAETVTVDNNYGKDQLPDVIATFRRVDGPLVTIAFEYETKECKHSIKELQDKRDTLKLITTDGGAASCFDGVVFVAKKEYTPHLIAAVGDDFVLTRGAAVGEYIETMKARKTCAQMPQTAEQSAEAA